MNLQNEVLFFHPLQINISEVFRIFRVTVNCLRFLHFFYHDSFMIPLTKKKPLQKEVLFFHPLQINISEVFRIFLVTVNCLRFLHFFYHDSFMIPLTKKKPPRKIDKPAQKKNLEF